MVQINAHSSTTTTNIPLSINAIRRKQTCIAETVRGFVRSWGGGDNSNICIMYTLFNKNNTTTITTTATTTMSSTRIDSVNNK